MKTLFKAALAIIFSVAFTNSQAQADQRKKEYNLEKSGVAIQGYDPVAYFTQNKAVEGSKENAYTYQSVTYYFASAKDRDDFKANPAKYEPQYGGWCAYAMGSNGTKVEIDPKTFKIKDGKLYLFYHSWTNNTLDKWNKNEATLNANADKNWSKTFHP